MRTRKVFRMPLDKILCLSANAILTIIALWSIASVFFENATIDSISPFQRGFCLHGQPIFKTSPYPDNILMAFVLIIVATALYVHKANKM